MGWDPATYEKFAGERRAPFADLVALIEPRVDARVCDLGCGTGELTAELAALFPGSDVVGIESSEEMLAKAAPFARPGLRFEHGAIEDAVARTGAFDIVFSHAAIHWVDDHEALVPRLAGMLRRGGRLAVQLPSNHEHPSHRGSRELAAEEPFASALGDWQRSVPVLPVERYAQLLFDAGLTDIVAFEMVYPHVLRSSDDMVVWQRGTSLVPYRERLSPELYAQLEERLRERLRAQFPVRPVFFGFKRILFAGTKP